MNGFEYCRLKAGLTQVEASHVLNVSQGAISGWERGSSYPTGNKIPAIAALYGCEISDLYRGCEEQEKLGGLSKKQYEMRMYEAKHNK